MNARLARRLVTWFMARMETGTDSTMEIVHSGRKISETLMILACLIAIATVLIPLVPPEYRAVYLPVVFGALSLAIGYAGVRFNMLMRHLDRITWSNMEAERLRGVLMGGPSD